MTEERKMKGVLAFFYVGKFVELGLIQGGNTFLTTKGFDMAIDYFNSGGRLTEEEMEFYYSLKEFSHLKEPLKVFVRRIQELGIDKFKEDVLQVKSEML